jgi:hypothetical protein
LVTGKPTCCSPSNTRVHFPFASRPSFPASSRVSSPPPLAAVSVASVVTTPYDDRASSTDAFNGASSLASTVAASSDFDRTTFAVAVVAVAAFVSNRRQLAAAVAVPLASLATHATAIDPTAPAHVTNAINSAIVRRVVVILALERCVDGVQTARSDYCSNERMNDARTPGATRARVTTATPRRRDDAETRARARATDPSTDARPPLPRRPSARRPSHDTYAYISCS